MEEIKRYPTSMELRKTTMFLDGEFRYGVSS